MDDTEWLVDRFEENRERLRGVAYRMLGSLAEADDAVQDTWIRLSRSRSDEIENMAAWLTTVVARVSLNMLRSRNRRGEEAIGAHLPDPFIEPEGGRRPEDEALLADSVGLALLVVLDTLTPAERLAFVLHDMFGLPFEEIAPMVGRSPVAARQLASRARRRVKGAELPSPQADPARQREVLNAFLAASRAGDFDRLVRLLDPDVVLRRDIGPGQPAVAPVVRGAEAVAGQALLGARAPAEIIWARVNGTPGVVIKRRGRPFAVMSFTVVEDRIAEIDIIVDPERVGRLAAAVLD